MDDEKVNIGSIGIRGSNGPCRIGISKPLEPPRFGCCPDCNKDAKEVKVLKKKVEHLEKMVLAIWDVTGMDDVMKNK